MSDSKIYFGYGHLNVPEEEQVHFDLGQNILGADVSDFFSSEKWRRKFDFPVMKVYDVVYPFRIKLANGDLFEFQSPTEICKINEGGARHGYFAEFSYDEDDYVKHRYIARFDNGEMENISISLPKHERALVVHNPDGSSLRKGYSSDGRYDAQNRPDGFFTEYKFVEVNCGWEFPRLQRRTFYEAGVAKYRETRKNREWRRGKLRNYLAYAEKLSPQPHNLKAAKPVDTNMPGKDIIDANLMEQLREVNKGLFGQANYFATKFYSGDTKGDGTMLFLAQSLFMLQAYLKAVETGAYDMAFQNAKERVNDKVLGSFHPHVM